MCGTGMTIVCHLDEQLINAIGAHWSPQKRRHRRGRRILELSANALDDCYHFETISKSNRQYLTKLSRRFRSYNPDQLRFHFVHGLESAATILRLPPHPPLPEG